MREVESRHPAGTIALPVGSLGRYWQLYASLDALQVPKGTQLMVEESASVAWNLNKIIREMKGEWLWVMGDDHMFRDDMLLKLLDRDVEIVVPIASRRGPPFQTVLYRFASLDASAYETYSWDDLSNDYPQGGMAVVEAAGSAGMLIRKHVIEQIPDPWFQWERDGKISEDVGFCLKARKAGFNIYADLDQTLPHMTPCVLEPYRKDGKWQVSVAVGSRRVSLTNGAGEDMRKVKYYNKPKLKAVA